MQVEYQLAPLVEKQFAAYDLPQAARVNEGDRPSSGRALA